MKRKLVFLVLALLATPMLASAQQVNNVVASPPASLGGVFSFPMSTATYGLGKITATSLAVGEGTGIKTPIYSTITMGPNAGANLDGDGDSIYLGNYAGNAMKGVTGYYEINGTTYGNGEHNVAVGPYAMGAASANGCTTGNGAASYAVAIGAYSLYNQLCTGGDADNSAVGDHSGWHITTGEGNTVIGGDNPGPTTGNYNTLLGYGVTRAAALLTTGAYNTCVGSNSCSHTLTTGSYNILIGVGDNSGAANSVDVTASGTAHMLNIGNLLEGDMTNTMASGVGTPASKALYIIAAASTVDYLQIAGVATATIAQPAISAQGTGTNISVTLTPKGTGGVVLGPITTPTDTQACNAGAVWVDTGFIYVCTASGTVKRATLSTF